MIHSPLPPEPPWLTCVLVCGPFCNQYLSLPHSILFMDGQLSPCECHLLFLQVLIASGAPSALVKLVAAVQHAVPWSERHAYNHVEFFAGQKAVTKAFVSKGCRALSFELKDCELLDVCSHCGYVCAILLCLRLAWGAGALAAPVCSSWVWVSRSSTKRSLFNPLGSCRCASVITGNEMVSKLCLLIWLLHSMGVVWLVEQPANSLLEAHPRWQKLIATIKTWRVRIYMGDYGAESPKPTWIYAPVPWIHEIVDFRIKTEGPAMKSTVVTCTRTVDARGRVRTTGGPDLKATQTYPEGFGAAVYQLHQRHRAESEALACEHRRACIQKMQSWSDVKTFLEQRTEDDWSDARIPEVMSWLRDA